MTTIKETLEVLFQEWKQARPQYVQFCIDGIIGTEDGWRAAWPKIAFMLKEPNDNFLQISRIEPHGPSGNAPAFWRNLSVWKYVVTSMFNGEDPSYQRAMEIRETGLHGVAYVNLKKKHEGKAQSNHRDIRNYVDEDWLFLSRQIKIISPDVLFFCSTFKYVSTKLLFEMVGPGIYHVDGRIGIDFWHPGNRYSKDANFFRLVECLRALPAQGRGTE